MKSESLQILGQLEHTSYTATDMLNKHLSVIYNYLSYKDIYLNMNATIAAYSGKFPFKILVQINKCSTLFVYNLLYVFSIYSALIGFRLP